MRFLARLLGGMLGIWVSAQIVSSIRIEHADTLGETLVILSVLSLVLTLINSIVRPLVRVVAFPLYLLTFGLFALVTNAIVFALAGWVSTQIGVGLQVGGFWPAVFGGTVTAIISSIVVGVFGDGR